MWSRRALAAAAVVVGLGAWAAAALDKGGWGHDSAPAGGGLIGLCSNPEHFEQLTEMTIFLLDDITRVERDGLIAELNSNPEVAEVEYVSKEQAYEDYVQLYQNQPQFYENLPEDAIPASIRIRRADTDAETLAAEYETKPGVDEIRYGAEILRNFCQDPGLREQLPELCEGVKQSEHATEALRVLCGR